MQKLKMSFENAEVLDHWVTCHNFPEILADFRSTLFLPALPRFKH